MTSAFSRRKCSAFFLVLCLAAAAGCGGGDGESKVVFVSNPGGDGKYTLQGLSLGRPLLDASGMVCDVVNPRSVVETHPLTGALLEGFPKTLDPDEPLDLLYPLVGSEPIVCDDGEPLLYDEVRDIPRDGAIVVHFSLPVDPDCLALDARSRLTSDSPIRVLTPADRPLPVQALVQGDRVILNPVTEEMTGFPCCPLRYDENRQPVTDPGDALRLVIVSEGTGTPVLYSASGKALAARPDLLGSPLKPIRFLVGPACFKDNSLGTSLLNGFLPDPSPPRIVREVRDEGIAGAGSGSAVIQDPAKSFVTLANNGLGEWAGSLLTLRPGQGDAEQAWVVYNTATTLYLSGSFMKPPAPGADAYLVQRPELYEPIPGLSDPTTAVDPANHPKDPFDPEDQKNWELFHFALFDAWNDATKTWEPVNYDPGPGGANPIDPKWRISFRFSESMDPASFRPYETFYVCDGNLSPVHPGFSRMKVGRVTARDQRRIIAFEPVLEDRSGAGADQVLGFGGIPKALRLVLRVVPTAKTLDRFYQALGPPSTWPLQVVEDLNAAGVLGVVSQSGKPLGLPSQFFNPASPYCVIHRESPGAGAFPPAADLKYGFNTERTTDPECGALVHRFMGLPETAVGGVPLITGVVYRDHEDKIYGPRLADIGFRANGFLIGHPVEFIQHVFDDYNPPPPSSPTYPDPISKMPFGVGTPVTADYGCRFQHVYRCGDCSPDVPAFEGSVLDLIGLAWAPIGGWVTNGIIEKMAIALSHSDIVPDTGQSSGIPNDPNSGLKHQFAVNHDSHEQVVVVGKEVPGGPDEGVPYLMDWKNLFAPKNAGPSFNNYLPWPSFDSLGGHRGFGFDSAHSLLIEYRLDKNELNPVPKTNGFCFYPAIITSVLPRFRAYSRGDDGTGGGLGSIYAASYPKRYPLAKGPLNPPANYGDNSRYFMVFDYVKRVSEIDSFYLCPEAGSGKQVDFLTPLVDAWAGEVPPGTGLEVTFQATLDPDLPNSPTSPWVGPDEVHRLNGGAFGAFDYLRFRAVLQANIAKGTVPGLDTVVIPYVVK